MVISTEVGTAQVLAAGEDARFYDDVGCLIADRGARSGSAHAFVRVADGSWIDTETASFARPASARTAMGSGIVAFATIAEARAADRAGRAWTWRDIQETSTGDEP